MEVLPTDLAPGIRIPFIPFSVDHPDARVAIIAAMGSLFNTALLGAVKQGMGSLRGHWICLAYALGEGTALMRSTYAEPHAAGVLSLVELCSIVIRKDLGGTGAVHRQIAYGGGLVLCPRLQAPVDDK